MNISEVHYFRFTSVVKNIILKGQLCLFKMYKINPQECFEILRKLRELEFCRKRIRDYNSKSVTSVRKNKSGNIFK